MSDIDHPYIYSTPSKTEQPRYVLKPPVIKAQRMAMQQAVRRLRDVAGFSSARRALDLDSAQSPRPRALTPRARRQMHAAMLAISQMKMVQPK